jgi:hypothetical protein
MAITVGRPTPHIGAEITGLTGRELTGRKAAETIVGWSRDRSRELLDRTSHRLMHHTTQVGQEVVNA